MLNWDFGIINYIQENLRCDILDRFMPFITKFGDAGIFWICITVVMLIFRKTRKTGAIMAAALVVDVICCNMILKPIAARTRPFDINNAVELLIAPPRDYSFPSGHTAASFAATSALYFGKNKLWIPSLVLSCMIAFSRLYLYVHFPTDVLAGAAFGILAGWIGCITIKTAYNKHKIEGKDKHEA